MAYNSGISGVGSSLVTAIGQLGRKKQSSREAVFAAQEAAQEAQKTQSGEATAAFLKFAKMSPAERIRAAYLEERGLSEQALSALPKEERDKIEEEIKQRIKKTLGLNEYAGAGQLFDLTA